jgi:hypothetical protein
MGGCAINLVDEESGPYNPGTVGLLHFDKLVAVSFPHSTSWLPEIADDISLNTWNGSVGTSYRYLTGEDDSGRFDVSLGLAYSYARMSWGEFVWTDPLGNFVGSEESYDLIKSYTASFAVDYYVRLGLGYTTKKIESRLASIGAGTEVGVAFADGDATDFGLLLELPIHRMVTGGIRLQDTPGSLLTLQLTPSIAYVQANDGDDMAYVDAAQADPLPKTKKIGYALAAALNLNDRELFAARYHTEKETLLVGDKPEVDRWGAEFGALGTAFVRFGSFEGEGIPKLSTFGFGFRLRGVLDWLKLEDQLDGSNGVVRYLGAHFDLSFDHARWKDVADHAMANTKFCRLSLSF